MLGLRVAPIALGALLLGCSVHLGCGGSPVTSEPGATGESSMETPGTAGGTSSREVSVASRIIPLGGAEYLLGTSPGARCYDRCGGIQTLGDVDGDGRADVVVAINRKGARAPAEQTWIEAYSRHDGERIWSLQGHYDRDPKKNYRLGSIAVVHDLDADGARDVYACEAYGKRSAFLISGRTGQVLGRYPFERRPEFELPRRWQDYDGDGTADLIFSRTSVSPLAVTVLSGENLGQLARLEGLWPEAGKDRVEWVLSEYHDDNGDQMADCLVRRTLPGNSDDPGAAYQYAILDGKTFAVFRTFKSPRPRVVAKTFFACIDDLNGDRVGDFVFSSGAGGGAEVWSVDVKTGQRKSLGHDVGFGGPIVTVRDVNHDGVDDLAALADAATEGPRPGVLVVSGKDGEVLSALAPQKSEGRLMRPGQMVRLPATLNQELPAIAVSARSAKGEAVLAIFDHVSPQ